MVEGMEEEKRSIVSDIDPKKKKKWQKKVEKGLVQSQSTYLVSRYGFGLQATPKLSYTTDKTREKSEHNLLTSELRNFILSLYYPDQPIQKNFDVCNRGFLRYVLHIHLSCFDHEDVTGLNVNQPFYSLKVTRSSEETPELTRKLLTIPFQECSEAELFINPTANVNDFAFSTVQSSNSTEFSPAESLWKDLYPYIANESMLKLYNFPLPIKDNSANDSKKMKTNDIPPIEAIKESDLIQDTEEVEESLPDPTDQIGLHLLPSIDLIEKVRAAFIFPCYQTAEYYQDFPKNQILVNQPQFTETMDTTSPVYNQLKEYLLSSEYSVPEPLAVVAIDCEMCETTIGMEVTRVTLIDHDEKVMLDILVKPENPIIDYHTKYSGITEAILSKVATKLIQVQLLLSLLIVKKTIVVGHSLENDLRVLRLLHYQVVDTTILYPHPIGYPYRNKLKQLAKEYLQREIQQTLLTKKKGAKEGHDSIEDALAALCLVKLKVSKGPAFGLPSTEDISIPITKRLSYLKVPSLLFHYQSGQEGVEECLQTQKFLESLLSNETKIEKVSELSQTIIRIKEFILQNQKHTVPAQQNSTLPGPGKRKYSSLEESEEEISSLPNAEVYDQQHFIHLTINTATEGIEKVRSFLTELHDAITVRESSEIQTHGLFVLSIQKSLTRIIALSEKKKKFYNFQNRMTALTWTREEEQELKELIKLNRLAKVCFCIL